MASFLQPKRPAPPSPLSSSSSSSSSTFYPAVTTAPRRSKMSITQTYYLAHKARAKLSNEAARSDHNLRLLVGHANLLDSLMIELADAEREQESWFNQSVRGAAEPQAQQQPQHYISSEDEDDWAVESDSESEDSELDEDEDDCEDAEYEAEAEEDDEDIVMADAISVRKVPQQLTRVPSRRMRTPLPEVFDTIEEEDEEEDEDFAGLGLARIPSHASPPELELDHDSDTSEDEAMPPSPPQDMLSFPDTAKDLDDVDRELADDATPDENHKAFYTEGYYVPPKSPARLLPAFGRVY